MPNQGPLSREDLMALWKSVTDPAYHRPLLENEDSGVEFIEQAAEQFARVSKSIDTNTQAMFILPWSGQTAPPAGGAQHASVNLSVRRNNRFEDALVFREGVAVFEQRLNDWGPEGPVDVSTARRYVAAATVALAPGDPGPVVVPVVAERPGYGGNVPPPGTINRIVQVGAGMSNTDASVVPGDTSHELRAAAIPDVPVLEHVGQQVLFTEGANAGRVANVVAFANPIPDVTGGSLLLSPDGVYAITVSSGEFHPGDRVVQNVTNAVGIIRALYEGRMVLTREEGNLVVGETFTNAEGAIATVDTILQSPDLVAETGTASWLVLDYVEDYGLEVTHDESPSGGVAAVLDEIGDERNIPRLEGEQDEEYRLRIAEPADVVSPNAIRRAGNRVLRSLGLEVCLREVGSRLLPGMFFDEGPTNAPSAFDLEGVDVVLSSPSSFVHGEQVRQVIDGIVTVGTYLDNGASAGVIVRVRGPGFVPGPIESVKSSTSNTIVSATGGVQPNHRFAVMLDLLEFRAFFLLGVPPLPPDEQQFQDSFFDEAAFDVGFMDGVPTTADARRKVYQRIFDEVNRVRAAGVHFELYVESVGCF